MEKPGLYRLAPPAPGAIVRRMDGEIDALVIGAGFAGLYQLHSLRSESVPLRM
jgi:hypothetical protein